MPGGLHPPPAVIASWPHPSYTDPETHGNGMLVITCTLGTLAFVIVGVRTWARARIQRNMGLDDWLMLAAMIPTLGLIIATLLGTERYGFDRHIWDVPLPHIIAQRKITFIILLNYVASSGLIKASVLLFYYRLGHSSLTRTFCILVWMSLAFVAAYTIVCLIMPFVDCSPTDAFWNQFNYAKLEAGYKYRCINESNHILIASIVSCIQDFITTTLPAILCWNLQLNTTQRVALTAIFAVGYAVCIIGILRVVAVTKLYFHSYDVSWEAWHCWLLTLLEVLMAIICSSASALRIFFRRYLEFKAASRVSKGYGSIRNAVVSSFSRSSHRRDSDTGSTSDTKQLSSSSRGDSSVITVQTDVEIGVHPKDRDSFRQERHELTALPVEKHAF